MDSKVWLNVIFLLVIVSAFLGFNNTNSVEYGQENLTKTSAESIKLTLEEELGQTLSLSEEVLQNYRLDIIEMVREENDKLLREKALYIQNKLDNNTLEKAVYQSLYYKAFYEGCIASHEQLDSAVAEGKLFLHVEDIQEEPIIMALIDIGLVTNATEEELQQLRSDVIKLIRGKQKTEKDFIAFQNDFKNKIKTMNKIDSSAYQQVFSVSQKEAFLGSSTHPLKD